MLGTFGHTYRSWDSLISVRYVFLIHFFNITGTSQVMTIFGNVHCYDNKSTTIIMRFPKGGPLASCMLVHFFKSTLKQQLSCGFDIMDSIYSFFCILTYAIVSVLIHHIIFRLDLYFLSIVLYFFKYPCTNIFHRRSLYTFYSNKIGHYSGRKEVILFIIRHNINDSLRNMIQIYPLKCIIYESDWN